MVSASSFTPRSSTLWFPSGIPKRARRSQHRGRLFGNLARMIEVGIDPDGRVAVEHTQQSSSQRIGSMTGSRVPIRTTSMCGTDRIFPRM